MGENAIPPTCTGHILGEGAAVFTNMTETMLTALDKQMTQPKTDQNPVLPPVDTSHDLDQMLILKEPRQDIPVPRAHQLPQSSIPTQKPKEMPPGGNAYPRTRHSSSGHQLINRHLEDTAGRSHHSNLRPS